MNWLCSGLGIGLYTSSGWGCTPLYEQVCNLGLLFNPSLSLEAQVMLVVQSWCVTSKWIGIASPLWSMHLQPHNQTNCNVPYVGLLLHLVYLIAYNSKELHLAFQRSIQMLCLFMCLPLGHTHLYLQIYLRRKEENVCPKNMCALNGVEQ